MNLQKKFFWENIAIFSATGASIWLFVWMGLYMLMSRVKNWKQIYVFSIAEKSTKQLACNWPSPCKLTFKRGYFLPNITIGLVLRLFWPSVRKRFCICVLRVKNWWQEYVFSKFKKSTKQLTCSWPSLCKLTLKRGYFLPN